MASEGGGVADSTLVLQTQAQAIVFVSEAQTELSKLSGALVTAVARGWTVGTVPIHGEVVHLGTVERPQAKGLDLRSSRVLLDALVAGRVLSQVLHDLSHHADLDEEDVEKFEDKEQARRAVAAHYVVNECWMAVMAAYKIYDSLASEVSEEVNDEAAEAAEALEGLCDRVIQFCVGLVEGYTGAEEGVGVVVAVRGSGMFILKPAPELKELMDVIFEEDEEAGEQG
ncbi:MAG: hypothetical protein Q7R39_17090 [Dehalococcoidia bacterium]|nr:hypothetical protein [Dehalococcoidia bacterium]